MPSRLVIVLPDLELAATRSRIAGLAVSGWEQTIRLVGGPTRRGAGDFARAQSKKILDTVYEFGAESLIVVKNICCDRRTLEERVVNLRRPSILTLNHLIKDELDIRGLSWRKRLDSHLRHWSSRTNDPGNWLHQFEMIGADWVGERLLRQIDVINPKMLVQAFEMSPHSMIGQDRVFTFILDSEDPASSSNRIGALLAQTYGLQQVKHFAAALVEAEPGAHLIVCEDALWTGIELRTLLSKLGLGGDLFEVAKGKRITFRHYIVTDYGLWIVRHYKAYAQLDSVDFLLDDKQRFIRVLVRGPADAEIRSHFHLPPTWIG